MVGDGRSWMGVVVCGRGWSFVVVWVCGVVVRVGSSSVWGRRPCGAWSSIGGHYRLCVRCGRPWGVVVVHAWGVVICCWGGGGGGGGESGNRNVTCHI